MNHKNAKRCSAFLLLLVLLTALLPFPVRAAGGSLFVTGYTVTDISGSPASSVTKGSVVNIIVSIKDTGTGADPSALDVTKLDDSFTGGSVRVENTSAGQSTTYQVVLSGVQYKGVGQSLKIQIGTAGDPDSYQTMELTVTEAVVYEAPTPTEPPAPPSPDAAPAPLVLVSRSELRDPVEPGQEFKLTVTFKNLSNLRLKSPVATFTPSDSLTILGGSTSFVLDEMTANGSASVKIRVKASDTISSPSQSLGVELKFNYPPIRSPLPPWAARACPSRWWWSPGPR